MRKNTRFGISVRRKIEIKVFAMAATAWSRSGCRYSKHPATIYNGLHVELWPFKGPVPWRNRPLNYGLFERDGYLNRRLLARPPQILQQDGTGRAARSVSSISSRETLEKARISTGKLGDARRAGEGRTIELRKSRRSRLHSSRKRPFYERDIV